MKIFTNAFLLLVESKMKERDFIIMNHFSVFLTSYRNASLREQKCCGSCRQVLKSRKLHKNGNFTLLIAIIKYCKSPFLGFH